MGPGADDAAVAVVDVGAVDDEAVEGYSEYQGC